MTALEELDRALRAASDNDNLPPCTGHGEWLSDDTDERREAAELCGGCPVFDACGAAADELQVRFGTWAGVDRGGRP